MSDELIEKEREAWEQPRFAVPVSSINILIVDDTAANRLAFHTLLEHLGYSIFQASSGHEAMALATRYRFAAILMDVRMPGQDGLDAAIDLRKKPFTRNTPILFVSAHQDTVKEVSQLAINGPVGFLHSPVDSELLVWKVKSYVEYYLYNEQLRLQAELVWQAHERFLQSLRESSAIPTPVRESSLNLGEALKGLKEALSDHFTASTD